MEAYINPILTIILIGIYWYNTKVQNNKINAQSDIIKDLKDHVKFFDVKKIKEYVELRETEKDKLLEITKKAIEKEFENKQMETPKMSQPEKVKDNMNGISIEMAEKYMVEPFTYISLELVWKSDTEINNILDDKFPLTKHILWESIKRGQKLIKEKAGSDNLTEIKALMDETN